MDCDDCTETELCPTHQTEWKEAERDRDFDERCALGYL